MKLFVLALLVAVAALTVTANDNNRIFEAQIKAKLQSVLKKLREEGIPSMNISSLDPLLWDQFDTTFNIPSLANISVNVTDAEVIGLTNVETPKLTFNLIGMKLTYGLLWPNVKAKGGYGLDADLRIPGSSDPEPIKIFGDGDASLEASGFLVEGHLTLGLRHLKYIEVKELDIHLSLEKMHADVTGLFHDPQLSQTFSKAISAAVPNLLDEFHQEITAFVNPRLLKIANKLLENTTIGDIIGYREESQLDLYSFNLDDY